MIERLAAATLLIALVAISAGSALSAGVLSAERVYSARIYTLAVIDGEGGSVIEVEFNVYYPGTGEIVVVDRARVSRETAFSIEYSILLASILSGVNYRLYDYEFVFPGRVRVKGLSGTLAFLLAVLSFYRNDTIEDGVGVTGLVSPNGLVGLVDELGEKYEAGIKYGLDRIIGPYEPELLNRSKYHPAIDVLSAYRLYSGSDLYDVSVDLNESAIEERYAAIDRAFEESYYAFNELLESLLGKVNETVGFANYAETSAHQLLLLARKYAGAGKWYTAATFIFRSYLETYEYYLRALLTLNETSRLASEVRALEEQIELELRGLKSALRNASNVALDLWGLDALLNSYIRYYIAERAFVAGLNGDLVAKAEYYPIAISRLYTVKSWLSLVNGEDSSSRPSISQRAIRVSSSLLRSHLVAASNYLYYLGLLDEGAKHELLSAINDVRGASVEAIANYTLILSEMCLLLQQLRPALFMSYVNYEAIADLNKSMNLLRKYIYAETGAVVPSMITLAELSGHYLLENTSLTIVGSLYFHEYVVLLPIIAVVHEDEIAASEVEGQRGRPTVISPRVEALYLLVIVTASVGSFLVGYSVGRLTRRASL